MTLFSNILWNVATLSTNVATLAYVLSVTLRRCPQRRDIAPNVATLPRTSRRCLVLGQTQSIFAFLTLYHHCLNPSSLHTRPHNSHWSRYHTGRRSIYCPPISSLHTAVTPSHTQSSVRASHSHYTPLRCSRTGLVIHIRSKIHLGSHLGPH